MHRRIFIKYIGTLPVLLVVVLTAALLAGCASRNVPPTLAAAKSNEADVLYEQARPLVDNREDEAAVRQLRKAIKAGSPEAAFLLSNLYE